MRPLTRFFLKAVKNTKKIVISEDIIIKTALKTLEIEAETVNSLKTSINEDFSACVKAIFQSHGRLVVTGVGKSALIAQKIVATLNSTGTPSVFMHASDAIHGDLGIIQPHDMVLCISKSGDTPEIKILVPLIKNLGALLIGMVSNKDSFLGRQAGYILHTPVSQEADPNNLAPTASTTAQLAMGDALATALLAVRGFSPHDFAQFHPGGSLGKQLYLRVHDLYPNNEKPAVHLEDSIRKTILEMTSKRLGATAVLNDRQQLQGIVTDGDLRRMLEREQDINRLKARDIMSRNPKTILRDALAAKALEIMRRNSITQLIVVDEDNVYLGVVHLHDIIREGVI
jgi:arabinose-5-phosphate isomerase